MKTMLRALAGATLLCILAPSAAQAETCPASTSAEAAKPKRKRGLGLGGLVGAARRSGFGNLLGTGNILGSGKTAGVAGAIAGTAIEVSEGGGFAAIQNRVAGLAGSGREAQIAGAVTGMAGKLASAQGGDRKEKSASSATACPAAAEPAADKAWN
jgi:hypothetical protein